MISGVRVNVCPAANRYTHLEVLHTGEQESTHRVPRRGKGGHSLVHSDVRVRGTQVMTTSGKDNRGRPRSWRRIQRRSRYVERHVRASPAEMLPDDCDAVASTAAASSLNPLSDIEMASIQPDSLHRSGHNGCGLHRSIVILVVSQATAMQIVKQFFLRVPKFCPFH